MEKGDHLYSIFKSCHALVDFIEGPKEKMLRKPRDKHIAIIYTGMMEQVLGRKTDKIDKNKKKSPGSFYPNCSVEQTH